MNYKQTIESHINSIKDKLFDQEYNTKVSNSSVLSGRLSRLIFLSSLDAYYSNEEHKDYINNAIKKEIEFINDNAISQFNIDGLAGFVHGVILLSNRNEIKNIEQDFFKEIDEHFITLSKFYLNRNNIDPFHGFIGIGNIMLLRIKKDPHLLESTEPLVAHLLLIVNDIMDNKKKDEIDFSLAHGLSAVLRFITEYGISSSQIEKYKDFISKLCLFILSHKKENRIPDRINSKEEEPTFAPLRWCHGDLGICYALGKAAKAIDNDDIYAQTSLVLDILTEFREPEDQELYSATICHGTLGVAHLFSKISTIYNSSNILTTTNYWYAESLKLLNSDVAHNYVDNDKNKAELTGALNGIEGVGLGLLAQINDGDECLDSILQL